MIQVSLLELFKLDQGECEKLLPQNLLEQLNGLEEALAVGHETRHNRWWHLAKFAGEAGESEVRDACNYLKNCPELKFLPWNEDEDRHFPRLEGIPPTLTGLWYIDGAYHAGIASCIAEVAIRLAKLRKELEDQLEALLRGGKPEKPVLVTVDTEDVYPF